MGSYGVTADGQRVDLEQQPAMSTGQMVGGQPIQMDTGGPDVNTPQGYLDGTLQSNLQSVQTRFNTQWKTIQDSAKHLDPTKVEAMLRELQQSATNEVAQIKQAATMRADTLQRLQQLGQQGQLGPDGEKLMWGVAAGKEVADSMFPAPTEAPNPFTVSSQVSGEEKRLESDIAGYHVTPEQPAINKIDLKHGMFGPVGLAVGALTSEKRKPSTIEKWDPDAEEMVKNKQGVWVREIGKWVESGTPDKDRQLLAEKHKQLKTMRDARMRLGQPGFSTGTVSKLSAMMLTGENPTGTLSDKVNASVLLSQAQQPKPKLKKLDGDTARAILQEAQGDKELARKIARYRGYGL